MATTGQDFTTYVGDAALPIFLVTQQGTTTPVNLSGVSEIIWTAQRSLSAAPVLTKKKSVSGEITFDGTGGTDGQFQVHITNADTTVLSGFYLHQAVVIDGAGNQTTVTTGRMQVARQPVWSYSGDPANSAVDAIRFLIGDTNESCPQLSDPEIQWAHDELNHNYGGAAICCESLASAMSRLADQSDGQSKLSFSQRARAYSERAKEFALIFAQRTGLVYAGGISLTDMRRQEEDADRVRPQFAIGFDDNLVPIGPSNFETVTEEQGAF